MTEEAPKYDNNKPIIDLVFLKDPEGRAVTSSNINSATIVFVIRMKITLDLSLIQK